LAYGARLESVLGATPREFESRILRQLGACSFDTPRGPVRPRRPRRRHESAIRATLHLQGRDARPMNLLAGHPRPSRGPRATVRRHRHATAAQHARRHRGAGRRGHAGPGPDLLVGAAPVRTGLGTVRRTRLVLPGHRPSLGARPGAAGRPGARRAAVHDADRHRTGLPLDLHLPADADDQCVRNNPSVPESAFATTRAGVRQPALPSARPLCPPAGPGQVPG